MNVFKRIKLQYLLRVRNQMKIRYRLVAENKANDFIF